MAIAVTQHHSFELPLAKYVWDYHWLLQAYILCLVPSLRCHTWVMCIDAFVSEFNLFWVSVFISWMFFTILPFQGLGRLSLVAACAAQSAASVVQVGTKEIQSKVPWMLCLIHNMQELNFPSLIYLECFSWFVVCKGPSLIDHGTWIALCSLCSSSIMVKLVVIIHFIKLTWILLW
jgi:hypothetical protein